MSALFPIAIFLTSVAPSVGVSDDLAPLSAQQDPAPARPPQQAPMPVPRIVAPRRTTRIDIDGDLSDWPETHPILLSDPRQISGSAMGAWRGGGDLTAVAFMIWDDTYLWFAAKVRDDWHRPLGRQAAQATEIPPADSIMLTIDPNRDTRSIGPDPGRQEDREFWLAEVQNQGNQLVLWDRLRGTARFVERAKLVVHRDQREGVTTYECRIPFDEILPPSRKPEPGLVFDAQVVVNDYDEVTDLMPQTRIGWTFGCSARIDPGLMGSVMLVEALRQGEALPEFKPAPQIQEDPVPPRSHWVGLHDRLKANPPIVVDGSTEVSEAGGMTRLKALEELEAQLASFPRADFQEYQFRIHRRMRRETDGIAASGLPWYWQHALDDVARRIEQPPPEKGFRLFRLPQGGHVVRSAHATFAIDPSGLDIEQRFGGGLDFIILTSPLDMTKRNDQLLLRHMAAKRLTLVHASFHLPGIDASKMDLVQIGTSYSAKGLKVDVVGRVDDAGLVTTTAGYRVQWQDGTSLYVSALVDIPDEVEVAQDVDLLLLSPRNVDPEGVVARLKPRLVVLDDVLQCAAFFGSYGRVPLQDAFALQADLLPVRSILLAPGESFAIER